MILNSSSEVGRLDVSHLGMWLNLDQIPLTEKGHPTELIASALRHQFSDFHRDAVASARTPDERASLVGLFTLGAHETRHFHDLLISPYGHRLMHLNVQAALAVQSAQGSLAQAKAIIVPLCDWSLQLETMRLFDSELTAPNPKLGELAKTLGTISRLRRTLDQGGLGGRAPFTATSVLEASAVLIQMAAAGHAFGIERLNEFSGFVRRSSGSKRYFSALEFIDEQLGPIPIGGQIVLLLAALCGDVFSDDGKALRSPVDVLVALTRWLSSTGKFNIRKAPTTKYDALDLVGELFTLSSTFLAHFCGRDFNDSMSHSLKMTSAMVTFYKRQIDGRSDDSLQYFRMRQLIQVYENFRDLSISLIANISADPTLYLADQYYDRLAYLPQPVMFLWSEYGLPATPDLERDFYIQHEFIVPNPIGAPQSILEQLKQMAYFDGEAYRSAIVLCPHDRQDLAPPEGMFKHAVPRVDSAAWIGYFDSMAPMVGLLTDGVEERLPGLVLDQPITLLELWGTKVYCGSGRIRPHGSFGNKSPEDVLRRWDTRYPNWPRIR